MVYLLLCCWRVNECRNRQCENQKEKPTLHFENRQELAPSYRCLICRGSFKHAVLNPWSADSKDLIQGQRAWPYFNKIQQFKTAGKGLVNAYAWMVLPGNPVCATLNYMMEDQQRINETIYTGVIQQWVWQTIRLADCIIRNPILSQALRKSMRLVQQKTHNNGLVNYKDKDVLCRLPC